MNSSILHKKLLISLVPSFRKLTQGIFLKIQEKLSKLKEFFFVKFNATLFAAGSPDLDLMLGQPTSRQGRGDAGSFLSERNNNRQIGKPANVSGNRSGAPSSVPPVAKVMSVDDQNCSSPISGKENSFFKGKAKKTEQKKQSSQVAKIKSRKRAARPAFADSSSDESHLPERPVKPTKRSKTKNRPFV